jgi:hypothetical protein
VLVHGQALRRAEDLASDIVVAIEAEAGDCREWAHAAPLEKSWAAGSNWM